MKKQNSEVFPYLSTIFNDLKNLHEMAPETKVTSSKSIGQFLEWKNLTSGQSYLLIALSLKAAIDIFGIVPPPVMAVVKEAAETEEDG